MALTVPDILTTIRSVISLSQIANRQLLGPVRVRRFPLVQAAAAAAVALWFLLLAAAACFSLPLLLLLPATAVLVGCVCGSPW